MQNLPCNSPLSFGVLASPWTTLETEKRKNAFSWEMKSVSGHLKSTLSIMQKKKWQKNKEEQPLPSQEGILANHMVLTVWNMHTPTQSQEPASSTSALRRPSLSCASVSHSSSSRSLPLVQVPFEAVGATSSQWKSVADPGRGARGARYPFKKKKKKKKKQREEETRRSSARRAEKRSLRRYRRRSRRTLSRELTENQKVKEHIWARTSRSIAKREMSLQGRSNMIHFRPYLPVDLRPEKKLSFRRSWAWSGRWHIATLSGFAPGELTPVKFPSWCSCAK